MKLRFFKNTRCKGQLAQNGKITDNNPNSKCCVFKFMKMTCVYCDKYFFKDGI